MKKDLLPLREREIFQTLKGLKTCAFVIIGGYAVNAYTLPRFSVDCDLVIKDEKERKKIGALLAKMSYKKEEGGENFSRYEKKTDHNFIVSMDLMIHTVTDRMSGAEFSADWIFSHSSKRMLKGKTITGELQLRIIDRDALLVMKISSCRSTDIRDVFMMLPDAKNQEWIKSETRQRCDFNGRMTKILDTVNAKQFKDGLSGVYGYVDENIFEKHRRALLVFSL